MGAQVGDVVLDQFVDDPALLVVGVDPAKFPENEWMMGKDGVAATLNGFIYDVFGEVETDKNRGNIGVRVSNDESDIIIIHFHFGRCPLMHEVYDMSYFGTQSFLMPPDLQRFEEPTRVVGVLISNRK